MGVDQTVDGEVQVSSMECLWELGDVGAELSGDDINDLDEHMLRLDDRREDVRDEHAEEMEGM
jgi:hypothetical protein